MKIVRVMAGIKALSFYEWRILMMSIPLLPVISLLLRTAGYNQTWDLLARFLPARIEQAQHTLAKDKALHIARMVAIAARYGFYHANCLGQSLLTWWLLAHHGISAEIRFGVKTQESPGSLAHAWVEYQGVNLCESPPSVNYAVMNH